MMPTYILTSVSTRIKTEARVIAFVTIEMLALYINQIVYWLATCNQINNILKIAILESMLGVEKPYPSSVTLPQSWMVLSEFILSSWFVRLLEAFGFRYHNIFGALHVHTTNAIWNATTNRARCKNIVANRIHKALLYALVAQVVLASATAHALKCKSFTLKELEQQSVEQQRFDTNKVGTKGISIPCATSYNNVTTRKIHNLCFMIQCTMEAQATVLTHNDDNTNTPFTFDLKPTEFGTDNCATHHICFQRDLFVAIMGPESSIGVRGVSGSSTAEGIGTVKFRLKDGDGK